MDHVRLRLGLVWFRLHLVMKWLWFRFVDCIFFLGWRVLDDDVADGFVLFHLSLAHHVFVVGDLVVQSSFVLHLLLLVLVQVPLLELPPVFYLVFKHFLFELVHAV